MIVCTGDGECDGVDAECRRRCSRYWFHSFGIALTRQAYTEMEHQLQSEVSSLREDYEAEIDSIRADAEAPLKQRNDLLVRDLKVSGLAGT